MSIFNRHIFLLCIIYLQLHLVFFREKYQSYNKAMHKFEDGLAVISIYLEVGGIFLKMISVFLLRL